MIKFGFKLKDIKAGFFDRKIVVDALDKASKTVLGKFGTYVRRAARASIKNRGRTSKPGEPPTNRTGVLRDFIFFHYDSDEHSVIIGPAKLSGKSNAPEVLEKGGRTIITFGKNKGKVVNIKARPYMWPAYESREKELPKLWQNSVK